MYGSKWSIFRAVAHRAVRTARSWHGGKERAVFPTRSIRHLCRANTIILLFVLMMTFLLFRFPPCRDSLSNKAKIGNKGLKYMEAS